MIVAVLASNAFVAGPDQCQCAAGAEVLARQAGAFSCPVS